MKEKLELVNFNLTPIMIEELIKFNSLKKELFNLENTNGELVKIEKLKNELNKSRIRFIKNFRENNKEEIAKYLQVKDNI